MISADAPVVFSKACELFVSDLTMRAWAIAGENDRKVIQVRARVPPDRAGPERGPRTLSLTLDACASGVT
jgi:hypothetical protein